MLVAVTSGEYAIGIPSLELSCSWYMMSPCRWCLPSALRSSRAICQSGPSFGQKDLTVALELCFPGLEGLIEREDAHAVQRNDWKWMGGPSVVVNGGYLPLPPSAFEPASPSETS